MICTCGAPVLAQFLLLPTRPGECTACYFRRTGLSVAPDGHRLEPEEMTMAKKKTTKKIETVEGPLTPKLVGSLEETRKDVSASIAHLQEFKVTTRVELDQLGELLQDICKRKDELEEKLQAITKPINEGLRQVRALFKGPLDALREAEQVLKGKIVDGRHMLEAKNATAIAATSQAVQQGLAAEAEWFAKNIAPTSAPTGVQVREAWTFEITDEAALPREFLMPNEQLIRAHVKAHKDKAVIPGIRVFMREDVAVSRAS